MEYKSRHHITNGLLSLAFDSLTGELLEFTREKNGENLIKNHAYTLPQPLAVTCRDGRVLRPGGAEEIARHPGLRARVTVGGDGRSVRVGYDYLWDGERPCAVIAQYTVELPEDRAESVWRLRLKNDHPGALEDVRFPCVNGVYLGETWEDDTLVYPYIAGVKVADPVTTFSTGRKSLCWRWQDYKYVYGAGSLGDRLPDGLYGVEYPYSGLISMKWLDYYGGGFGFYFGCHDPELRACSLRADTQGAGSPGMNFSFRHPLNLRMGEGWESPETVAALHDGDWRRAADRYREFHRQVLPAETASPDWFQKSPGLMAHYDFKYQNGGIVHRFSDISRLLDEARELGMDHLLIAGWHHDGFDHGFPEYYPDEELGTEEELKEQVSRLIDRGGHVCFYINARLANTEYKHRLDFIAKNGIRLPDGSIKIEHYGAGEICFAAMCSGAQGWQELLADTVRYVTEDIGIDGVYLDVLSQGAPDPCTNPEHDHKFGEWNTCYQRLLRRLHAQREQDGKPMLSTIHEGCSDSYGPMVSGQLISTNGYHHNGAFPELYRYTFPEQLLVDMLYPYANQVMRPVHVGQIWRDNMDRAFRLGLYYWVYDLVDDNSFTRDPEGYAYLQRMIALRRFWLESFGQGEYQDTEGLAWTEEGVAAARYQLEDGILIACSNTTGRPAALAVAADRVQSAACCTTDSLPEALPAGLKQTTEGVIVSVPDAPLSLIFLKTTEQ